MTGIELPPVVESKSPSSLPRSKTKQQSLAWQWFHNLPVRGKQLTGLLTSEVISAIGLVGIGTVLIVAVGRTELQQKAESELAVAQINYNIKIDQLAVSFRDRSNNPAVIAAALAHTKDESLTPQVQTQVKQILQNAIATNNIEYATLVGKDLRIIVNANADRAGETFDPNNLVSAALKSQQQIKASQIVSWADLVKESPPSLKGLAKQDALIRYTVTPVKDADTGEVIAALVAGDVVNGKREIVENALNALGGGYSAIYSRQPSGELTLATALDRDKTKSLPPAQPDVPLTNLSLLQQAVAAPDRLITGRAIARTQSYTISAKALTDFNGKPIAVLLRGTSETALNQILGESILLLVVVLVLTFGISVWLAVLLGRTISQPLKQLQQTAEKFANGDRMARAEVLSTDEVGQLAHTFNELAQGIVVSEATLVEQARRQKSEAERSLVFAEVTSHIYKSLKSEDILKISVDEVRKVLQTDRVVIYRFNPGYLNGTIVSESVAPGWTEAMGQAIDDPLGKGDVERYRNGRVAVCHNINEAGFSECHCQILERLEVKANIVAPILRGNKLVALLCAHQCSEPRFWQQDEIFLFKQLAAQIGFALNQANLLEQLDRSRQEAELARQEAESVSQQVEQARQISELASQEQRQQKESLQQQVIELLSEIEASARGDLTVRAQVTESEIGTVADFFNSIIESLRQLVTQVKLTSSQVNVSLQEDACAVGQLSQQALKQAQEITCTLDSIQQMTDSIIAVAQNASQAAAIARTASNAAQSGGEAIDNTVETIVNLQKTVVETADKVRMLGSSSKQIAKVVSLVQDIALQTNLLSINAGLEATRSGEEGEAFRVVAAQVGALATQAANATRAIEQVIKTIELGTQEVVEAMEESKTQVVHSTRLAIHTKQNLEQIIDVSRQIDELVQSISDATVSQAQTSRIVADLMQEVASTSQHTSDSSGKVSNSLRQTVEVAQALQRSVGQFKIGD